jgi:hypothetical protein
VQNGEQYEQFFANERAIMENHSLICGKIKTRQKNNVA